MISGPIGPLRVIQRHPNVGQIVALQVDLDLATAGAVGALLEARLACLERGRRLILDTERRFVDVTGLRALEAVAARARGTGRRFALAEPGWSLGFLHALLGPEVRLPLYPTIAAAESQERPFFGDVPGGGRRRKSERG